MLRRKIYLIYNDGKNPGIENTELFKVLQQCMKERISKKFENEFKFPDDSKAGLSLEFSPCQGEYSFSQWT